jgi:hypothetical protein
MIALTWTGFGGRADRVAPPTPLSPAPEDWILSVGRKGAQVRFVYDVRNEHDNLLFSGT